jgi:hypothetical protein
VTTAAASPAWRIQLGFRVALVYDAPAEDETAILEAARAIAAEMYGRVTALLADTKGFWQLLSEEEVRTVVELLNRLHARSVRYEACRQLGLHAQATRLGRENVCTLASLSALLTVFHPRAQHPGAAELSRGELDAFLELPTDGARQASGTELHVHVNASPTTVTEKLVEYNDKGRIARVVEKREPHEG